MTQPSCSTRDAGQVLVLVAACHRKTAPRLDDREAALAIAATWAELFSAHNLTLADLLAGVKLRAQHEAEAPEPADVIEFARKVRRDRPRTPEEIAAFEALCESKSDDAAELAEARRRREISPPVPRPNLPELMGNVGKAVPEIEHPEPMGPNMQAGGVI